MLLALDIGNTKIAVGVFDNESLVATWRLATDVGRSGDEYAVILLDLIPRQGIGPGDIKAAIISSVVPPLVATFEELCQRYFGLSPLVVGSGIKTGVRICTENPKEVGTDRVVNALAAHRLYGGPLIVIDFGTATTFDAVSREGDYLGGAIAPGVGISAEALFERTAKLPRVEMVWPKHVIGRNTVTAIQAGLLYGYAGLVEGIVARMRREMGGTAKVIATGGLARTISSETKVVDVVDTELTLVGLRFIYEINRA